MNTLKTWLKNIRLDRILTAFMVGILLFVSTACSNGVQAKTSDKIREEVPTTGANNVYNGGMNDYSDVDARRNTTEANTKAKALVDNAKRNTSEKIVDSPQQLGDRVKGVGNKVGDAIGNIKENASDSVENVKEDVSRGTQKNLRQTQNLADDAKYQAIQTKESAKDAAKGVKRAAEDVSQAGEYKINQGVKSTQRALEDTADASDNLGYKIKRGAQDVADTVKSTVNKAADAID
ncbi:MAG: DUF6658 family protein [Coleofasciculaceae cyanobacterium]